MLIGYIFVIAFFKSNQLKKSVFMANLPSCHLYVTKSIKNTCLVHYLLKCENLYLR